MVFISTRHYIKRMDNKFIERKIADIIKKIKFINGENILDVNISNFSSLEFVELIVEIEEYFNIQFVEEDLLLTQYKTIGDIVKKIELYL